jgi:hypothetical protein
LLQPTRLEACLKLLPAMLLHLSPTPHTPVSPLLLLQQLDEYKMALSAVSKALDPVHGDVHFEALQNLMRPARQLAPGNGSGSATSSSNGSPTASSDESDGKGPGLRVLGAPILPSGLLPAVGASGVLLPGGLGGRQQQQPPPQQQQPQQQLPGGLPQHATSPVANKRAAEQVGVGVGNGRLPTHVDED